VRRSGSPEEKKQGAGLEDKKEIRDKEKGGGEEEMHLQGSEPQVSLINKGIVPVGDG
jgi:hypothetical protein